jgi:hypothetical protein
MADEKDNDDLIPLAPLDEEEEARRRQEHRDALAEQQDLMAEMSRELPVPLEHREDLGTKDLEHFVINYCLDIAHGQHERAQQHIRQLRKFGKLGQQTVEEFLAEKMGDPALKAIPPKLAEKWIRRMLDQVAER